MTKGTMTKEEVDSCCLGVAPMTDGNGASRVKFDLEERTTKFGKAVVSFAKSIPVSTVTIPLISQLVRSGTSVGANYCEADDAESKRDFRHKIAICRKEARETKYWLQMVVSAEPPAAERARELWREAKELHLIFSAFTAASDPKVEYSSLLIRN